MSFSRSLSGSDRSNENVFVIPRYASFSSTIHHHHAALAATARRRLHEHLRLTPKGHPTCMDEVFGRGNSRADMWLAY
jgi:hypothetical protein